MSKVKLGIALLILVALFLAFNVSRPGSPTSNQQNILSLQPPAFAYAEGVRSYLDNEAGISAYVQLPTTINFFYVRDLFRTIELETSTYIIGSIGVSGHPESQDVHVYIHEQGWVLAYYLATEPTSKILNWQTYNPVNITTKLDQAINDVAEALQVVSPTISYYHFHYPEATHLMFITESTLQDTNDSFQVNIPDSFTYYERSWYLGSDLGWYQTANYHLNGQLIGSLYYDYGEPYPPNKAGLLTEQQLVPSVNHSIQVSLEDGSFCSPTCRAVIALALVYQEPAP